MSPRKSLLDPADSKWDREVTSTGGNSWTHFNRDDLRRQMQSMRVLEQLLKRAGVEDLPALTWTVTSWSVAGELTLLDDRTPFQRRDVFLAWATALGFDDWREGRPNPGQVELRGHVKVPVPRAPHLEVSVVVSVVWWEHESDDVSTENA